MREILYLSFDSLKEGVGASQVLAYMRKVQPLIQVTILSFEKEMPSNSEKLELESDGLLWKPLHFGRFGFIGGMGRVYRMWREIDRSRIIHARSTLPALAALLRFPKKWIWDCRSLQADQRRALSFQPRRNLSFIVMRIVEYVLAKRATSIIVITKKVLPVFISRYRISPDKLNVIPTCVDVDRFNCKPSNRSKGIKLLFAGTFSPAYDLPLINKIIAKLRERIPVSVTIAASKGATNHWKQVDYDFIVSLTHEEMPRLIQDHDLGFSIWRNDLGVCLTSVASTKTAEFLACGRPVVINSLQGDFGALISEYGAGVVTSSGSEIDIDEYVDKIIELVRDKDTATRCRELATTEFNLDNAVSDLIQIYKKL